MPFTIKDYAASKCFSCVHANTFRIIGEMDSKRKCEVFGKIMPPMAECGEWLPHCKADPPFGMRSIAWSIEQKPKGHKIGFAPGDVEILSPEERKRRNPGAAVGGWDD